MRIAHLAHASLEVDASALLNDVRGFVRSRMKVEGRGERNMVASREGLGPHRLRTRRSRCIRVRCDIANVMTTERTLDLAGKRQWLRAPGDTSRGRGMHGRGLSLIVRASARRCCGRRQLLNKRVLAGCRMGAPRLGWCRRTRYPGRPFGVLTIALRHVVPSAIVHDPAASIAAYPSVGAIWERPSSKTFPECSQRTWRHEDCVYCCTSAPSFEASDHLCGAMLRAALERRRG
jgi:hypothetical protein